MKTNWILCRVTFGMLVAVVSAPLVSASTEYTEGQSTSAQTEDNGAVGTGTVEGTRLARLLEEASLSQGVSEVAKMAELKADVSVLTAHVQSSDKPYKLRPEDVQHLRDHDVPDSVITAMIERGAELRAKMPPAPPPVQTAQLTRAQPASTVVFVASSRNCASPPASTLTIIGSSQLKRGLSYRNYYYSPYHYYSSRPYGTLYASFGDYYRHGYGVSYRRGHHRYRVCR